MRRGLSSLSTRSGQTPVHPLRIGDLLEPARTIATQPDRMSKLFQSPSHRGTYSELQNPGRGVCWPAGDLFQSPSHRGTYSDDGAMLVTDELVVTTFQSPSHRGTY